MNDIAKIFTLLAFIYCGYWLQQRCPKVSDIPGSFNHGGMISTKKATAIKLLIKGGLIRDTNFTMFRVLTLVDPTPSASINWMGISVSSNAGSILAEPILAIGFNNYWHFFQLVDNWEIRIYPPRLELETSVIPLGSENFTAPLFHSKLISKNCILPFL